MDKIEITNEFVIALLKGIQIEEKYKTIDDVLLCVLGDYIKETNRVNPFDKIRTFNISYSTQATDLLEEEGM